ALARREFSGGETNRILVVLEYGGGSPLAPERIDRMYDLSRWLAARPGVTGVTSAVDLDPSVTREQYRQLAAAPPSMVPPAVREALRQLSGSHVALLVVDSSFPAGSEEARALVRTIRQSHPPVDGRVLVTGHTAFDLDVIGLMRENAPRAVLLIAVA